MRWRWIVRAKAIDFFFKYRRMLRSLTCKHRELELDYYSDCGTCLEMEPCHCTTFTASHAEQLRGMWFGQGDQQWAFYCKSCGTAVRGSYYIEATQLIKKRDPTAHKLFPE